MGVEKLIASKMILLGSIEKSIPSIATPACIQNLVNKEMQSEIINELIGPQGNGLERMLEESPSVSEKRKKLKKSIKLLKESKDVVANIMDRVVANVD